MISAIAHGARRGESGQGGRANGRPLPYGWILMKLADFEPSAAGT